MTRKYILLQYSIYCLFAIYEFVQFLIILWCLIFANFVATMMTFRTWASNVDDDSHIYTALWKYEEVQKRDFTLHWQYDFTYWQNGHPILNSDISHTGHKFFFKLHGNVCPMGVSMSVVTVTGFTHAVSYKYTEAKVV